MINCLVLFTAPYQSDPPKNKQVIAPFSDGNRYRALVIKIQNDKAQIVYTDFGNVDEVNVKELQILPENLALVGGIYIFLYTNEKIY